MKFSYLIFLTPFVCVSAVQRYFVDLNWDHILFTQQWPISNCIYYMSINPNHSCNIFPNITSWTVHGLWPSKGSSIGPNYCNSSWHFNMSEVVDLEPYLIKYWTDVYANAKFGSLWKHEWTKHGTCAAELPALDSEHKYFQKGVEWVSKYDLVAVLTKYNITPDDEITYKRDDIFNAIKDTFSVNSKIDCNYDLKTQHHYLSQIKLCVDVSFKLIDCGSSDGFTDNPPTHGNCPVENITYPASVRVNDSVMTYTKDLAQQHLDDWKSREGHCVTWLCHALMATYSLMWITL